MASLLETYGGPTAPLNLFARYPELRGIVDVTIAVTAAQAAGQMDSQGYRKAANITQAYYQVLTAILDDEGDSLPVDELIALYRIRRGIRDASLTFPWPYTPSGDGTTVIVLTPRAEEALGSLLVYEPLRDFDSLHGPRYAGSTGNLKGMVRDAQLVSSGFSLKRS